MASVEDIFDKRLNQLERGLIGASLELENMIVEGTPEDTGRAKGGWEWETFPNIHKDYRLVNPVEYILPLEYGHSEQAPYGMVRITVPFFPQLLKKHLNL